MEIREVKIEEYWPLIVKNTVEFGQIAAAENPEFNRLAKCIYQVLQESFVHDATEYGVKRWESILGINPASGATLDDRKATILTYLSVKVPYTWRVLKQMLVPVLGGEDKFEMEYFNDEYKLVLHTDRLNDTMLATVSDLLERVLPQNIEVVRYNHNIEISWRDINKYAECTNIADMLAVNPDYKKDLTSEGDWVYPLTNLQDGGVLFLGVKGRFIKLDAPSTTNTYHMFEGGEWEDAELVSREINSIFTAGTARKLTIICTGSPKAVGAYAFAGNFDTLELYVPTATNMDMPYNASQGKYELRNVKLTLGKLESASNAFAKFRLSKESTLHVLNEVLPLWTDNKVHPITIGIHVDHKTDEEVLEAIANAEAKGWTLTVQWNGTPTSGIATTDLEEIYAKVTESEHGEYVNENGNRCMLDWGHYVTDTTEYKLVYSLVEAEQYFKLNKIEVNENE